MKKRILSLFMAAMSVAMFGILYPEYILLPDTYEYIAEKSPKQVCETCHGELAMEDLTELLYETPENIRRIMQGNTLGQAEPDRTITRAEAAAMEEKQLLDPDYHTRIAQAVADCDVQLYTSASTASTASLARSAATATTDKKNVGNYILRQCEGGRLRKSMNNEFSVK